MSYNFLFYFRLKSLINQANVMIFMKGNKQAARCGFSNQLIQILNQTGYVINFILI